MDLPEHVSPNTDARRGKAPYNFVPLPDAIFLPPDAPFKEHYWLNPERLYGFIDLDITTETELYTRSAYPPSEEGKDVQRSRPRQAFYHHGDEECPVIPGSSLRGMVRSLVEILSYSRITRRPKEGGALRIRDEQLVHRAVADQQTPTGQAYNKRFLKHLKPREIEYPSQMVQAGYLEKKGDAGEWQIRPALKIQGTSFVRVPLTILEANGVPAGDNEVRDVWVKPAPVKPYPHRNGLTLRYARTDQVGDSPAPGLVRGVLVCSGGIASRHMHTVVYAKDPKQPPIPIPEEMWEQYCEDRDQQRGIPCRKIRSHGDPLFYLVDERANLVFLGPTLFFRLPYPHYTGDYVPQTTVEGDGPLDLAESIFGTVNGEAREGKAHTGAHRGRVQFCDAALNGTPDGGSPFLEGREGIRWPSVLSSPKPTSYQNYLVQRDPEGRREKLLSYSAPPPDKEGSGETTVLRGLKLYWHRGSAAPDLHLQPPTQHLKQYTVIRPVKPQVSFRGRLRFENLKPLELGALLAALDLPAHLRHHLGMGKPLGMGSVKIRAMTTLIDPVVRYRSLAAHGHLDEALGNEKLDAAREAFRSAVVAHHNAHARDSLRVAPDADLWEIPRLQALQSLLDWERRPPRQVTEYIRDLKAFRLRQVLPTPATVMGRPEPGTVRKPARDEARAHSPIIAVTPALAPLKIILDAAGRSQRERLDALDEALLAHLEALAADERELARTLISESIGWNKKSRDRLQAIEKRLRGIEHER